MDEVTVAVPWYSHLAESAPIIVVALIGVLGTILGVRIGKQAEKEVSRVEFLRSKTESAVRISTKIQLIVFRMDFGSNFKRERNQINTLFVELMTICVLYLRDLEKSAYRIWDMYAELEPLLLDIESNQAIGPNLSEDPKFRDFCNEAATKVTQACSEFVHEAAVYLEKNNATL